MLDYTQAFQGGVLIGLSCWILLAGVGRIGGVSGIIAGVLTSRPQSTNWRWAFLFGLVIGGVFFTWLMDVPAMPSRSMFMLVPAGLLVGFGTVLGAGCTSGHGICGLGRRSKRSLIAVAIFMGVAISTVLVVSHMPPAEWWASLIIDAALWMIGR